MLQKYFTDFAASNFPSPMVAEQPESSHSNVYGLNSQNIKYCVVLIEINCLVCDITHVIL